MNPGVNAVDVGDVAALGQVTNALKPARELAVDVEADMHHFHSKLCFVQLGTDRDIFLVDTLAAGITLDPLKSTFADAAVTKFFHAAQGDLQYLAEAGVRVQGLFDTHRAATLLGWPKVGLGDLVQERLGVTLKKEHQQADFSQRPLPGELRDYIADDVRYLCEVGRQVREACEAADVLEEVLLDCQRMCDEAAARPDVLAGFRPKLPRGGLSKEAFAIAWHVAHALHRKRLAWAEAEDLPTGRMLSNMALTEIATKLPDDVKKLARLPGVRGAVARAHGDEVLALIAEVTQGVKAGALVYEEEKKERDSAKKKREEALLEWRKQEAVQRKVTPSAVLSNALVADLAAAPPASVDDFVRVPYLGEKRAQRYAEVLLPLLRPQ